VKPKWTPQKCFCSGLHITLKCYDTKLRIISGCVTMSLLVTPKGRTNKEYQWEPLFQEHPCSWPLLDTSIMRKKPKQETSVHRMMKKKPTKRLHTRRATGTKGPSMLPQNWGAVLKDVMQLGYLTGHRLQLGF